MAKYEEKLFLDLNSEEADILEDVQPEDFVFVVSNTGQLRGISWPEDMKDDDDVNPDVEEIIKFLVKKYTEVKPADVTVH